MFFREFIMSLNPVAARDRLLAILVVYMESYRTLEAEYLAICRSCGVPPSHKVAEAGKSLIAILEKYQEEG